MGDLTKGTPLKQIVLFSVPLIIGNLFQMLYSVMDTLIVGRTLGVKALGGIGVAGSVMFLILGFSQGFTAGLTIPLAQAYGARDYSKVRRSVLISWSFCVGIAVILTGLSLTMLPHLLRWMNTPDDLYQFTYQYLQIILSFIIVPIFFNLLSNMMRALGDSRTPLYFLIVATVMNIILDYTLIVYVGMGIRGAAVATVFSQFLAASLCWIAITQKLRIIRPHLNFSQMRWEEVKYHAYIAFPMAFQVSIIAIGATAITVALNNIGSLAVASYVAAQRADDIVILVLMSFGVAMATYAGQNFGAEKYDRIREGVKQISILSVSIAIFFGIVLLVFGDSVVTIFVSGQPDPQMLEYGRQYFLMVAPFYSLLSLLFIYRNTLQGIGNSRVPVIGGMMELVMRVGAAFILSQVIGFYGLAISSPLAWLGAVIPLAWTYHRVKDDLASVKQKKKETNSIPPTID